MLIFGHDYIDYDAFVAIDCIDDIASTQPNQTVFISSIKTNIDTVKYCKSNGVKYAIVCQSAKDAIFANALKASYIITDPNNSKVIQEIATEYMFDAKILASISSDDDIESIANLGIDGVILEQAIQR